MENYETDLRRLSWPGQESFLHFSFKSFLFRFLVALLITAAAVIQIRIFGEIFQEIEFLQYLYQFLTVAAGISMLWLLVRHNCFAFIFLGAIIFVADPPFIRQLVALVLQSRTH